MMPRTHRPERASPATPKLAIDEEEMLLDLLEVLGVPTQHQAEVLRGIAQRCDERRTQLLS
jgi:hypothetical protein